MQAPFRYGIIEGFFGRPWSWDDREAYAAFLEDSGFDYYIYAPKGDRILRQDWPGRWPAGTLDSLHRLGEIYRSRGLAWGIGLNLFELHLRYDAEAIGRLENKVRYLNDLQPDLLAILFDDMRGDVDEIARIQADVTHRAVELSTAESVIMCPTYYSDSPLLDRLFGERPAGYLEKLGRDLDPAVGIFWTGPDVCSPSYPVEHLKSVGERLGRKPYIWDNYPVNDSEKMSRFLHLRAFEGRPHEMSEWTAGHAVNPMNQSWLSRIPLLTLDINYRRMESYDPEGAWEEAARRLCGEALAECLEDDLSLFHDAGLDRIPPSSLDRLIERYSSFDSPYAREVTGWLRGEYPYSPECVTE